MAKNGAPPVLVIERIVRSSLDTIKELLKIDWKETSIRLAGYASFRARNLGWRTGRTDALAKGLMPDDIAAQAILSVISGERAWEPDRGPLLPFLKRVVDSLMNHLAESNDNSRLERFISNPPPIAANAYPIDFEDSPELGDTAEKRIDLLFEAAAGKPELIEVLEAIIEFGEPRPRFIAARIGKPVSHVNNCFKRLRRLALKVSATLGRSTVSGGASVNP